MLRCCAVAHHLGREKSCFVPTGGETLGFEFSSVHKRRKHVFRRNKCCACLFRRRRDVFLRHLDTSPCLRDFFFSSKRPRSKSGFRAYIHAYTAFFWGGRGNTLAAARTKGKKTNHGQPETKKQIRRPVASIVSAAARTRSPVRGS